MEISLGRGKDDLPPQVSDFPGACTWSGAGVKGEVVQHPIWVPVEALSFPFPSPAPLAHRHPDKGLMGGEDRWQD